MTALAALGSASAALLVAVGFAWAAYAAATACFHRAATSSRLAATAVFAYATLYAVLRLLLAFGIFGLPSALLGAIAVGTAAQLVASRRIAVSEVFRSDVDRVRSVSMQVLRSRWHVFIVAAAGVAAIRIARGLVLPPMAWDALTYHLPKAARWVQLGRAFVLDAPDIWRTFENLPAAGSALWAWALVTARDGAWLAVAGGLVLGSAVLGTYAAARRFGASERTACAAAAAVATCPAVACAVSAAYVDNTMLALLTLALVFWARNDGAETCFAVTTGLALGLAAAVKPTALPIAVVGVAVEAARALFRGRSGFVRFFSFSLAVVAMTAIEYGGTWLRTGSPIFPLGLSIAGWEIFHGYSQFLDGLAGRAPGLDPSAYPWTTPFGWMFLPWRRPGLDFAGLGTGAVLIFGMAVVGTREVWRDPRRRFGFSLVLLAGGVVLAAAFGPSTVHLRAAAADTFSRYVAITFAVAAIAAAGMREKLSYWIWLVAVLFNAWLALPRGWGAADRAALRELGVAAGAGLAIGVLPGALSWLWCKSRRGALAAAGLTAALAIAIVLPSVRARYRYPIWSSARSDQGAAYDLHWLTDIGAAAVPIWERLDGGPPVRIAVTSGWDGSVQWLFLYPLMGSRLQNEVTYVPPTIDGSVVDYADSENLGRKAQLSAWMRRLIDERIDRIVVLRPSPPERGSWMDRLPDIFPLEIDTGPAGHALYRFDRDAAALALGRAEDVDR